MSGHGDIPMSVRAVKAGAVDFLAKPVNGDLCSRPSPVRSSVCDGATFDGRCSGRTIALRDPDAARAAGAKEVAAGRLSKQIAADLGTVERTIKAHRSRIMEKMKVASLLELGKLIEVLRAAGDLPIPARASAEGPGRAARRLRRRHAALSSRTSPASHPGPLALLSDADHSCALYPPEALCKMSKRSPDGLDAAGDRCRGRRRLASSLRTGADRLRFRGQVVRLAEALLDARSASEAACLVVDIRLPGISGVDMVRRLGAHGQLQRRSSSRPSTTSPTASGPATVAVSAISPSRFSAAS